MFRIFFLALVSLAFGSGSIFAANELADDPVGSSYSNVWATVQKGPYSKLPQYSVKTTSFFKGRDFFNSGKNILEVDAKRTLHSSDDILPNFQKLVHPIGICFAGTWTITEETEYTGYFAPSKALIIMRASEASGQPLNTGLRALGLAGKIFPTSQTDDTHRYQTGNFFTIDDLGGAKGKSFFDLAKTNAPPLSKHLSTFVGLPMLLAISSAFTAADKTPGADPTVRQLYPISELGLADPDESITPDLMSLEAEVTERTGKADFRDELRLENFPNGLKFSISVGQKGEALKKIGMIELTEEALSDGCDHQLHFPHPKWK